MSTYSVAEAKSGLTALINRAMAGEEVIITRHGTPVVEIRPTVAAMLAPEERLAAFARLQAHRIRLPPGAPTSVELLNMIYDEPNI